MYYAFSIRLDPGWIPPKSENGKGRGTFFQLHKIEKYDSTGPALGFQVTNKFSVHQHVGDCVKPVDYIYDLADTNLNRGKWIDFVLKMKYSINGDGEIMLWRRNEGDQMFTRVLQVNNVNTLLYKMVNQTKTVVQHEWHAGFYRTRQKTDGTGVTNILWLDGFTFATSAADAQFNAFNSLVVDLPGDGVMCGPPIVFDSVNNVLCNGGSSGSIFLKSFTDISTCQFEWTGPNGFSASTQNITNIGAGDYTYTVTNNEACSTTGTVTVAEPALLVAHVSYGTIPCYGDSTTVTITATGGVPPYLGTSTRKAKAGDFTYTVRDKNGCSASASGTIPQPLKLIASASIDSSIKCYGGTTTLTVFGNGGTTPYTGTGTFVRGVGDYTFPINDVNACKDTLRFSVKQQPSKLDLTKHVETMVSCLGGSDGKIRLVVIGGTPPYKYSFDSGRTFQQDSIKTGLAAGSYDVAFMDANQCLKFFGNKIIITEPAQPVSETICYERSTNTLHVVGMGGIPPYKYSLDGIGYKISNTTDGGRDFTHTKRGRYTVFVKDYNSCIQMQNVFTGDLNACPGEPLSQTLLSSLNKPKYLNVNVSPNPSNSIFNLKLEGNFLGAVEVQVWDIYGKVVYHIKSSADQTYKFGESLIAGVYILKILHGSEMQSVKLVKL
jgi:hypothetical protein